MTPIRTLALAGLTVIASMGAASAAQIQAVPADQYYGLYQGPALAGIPLVRNGVAYYGHAGSIGRLNYGASPARPEGPGNFSD
jgi:hypothetical protein